MQTHTTPTAPEKYTLKPAHSDDADYFYALSPRQDEELGAVGHLRIDFGSGGTEWYSTWHPRGPEDLNTAVFRSELDALVCELRQEGGLLHDLSDMKRYCNAHGGEIQGGWQQNYGYEVETEQYRYRIRCNPHQGDYQCYVSCFDKIRQTLTANAPVVGRITFANGEKRTFKDAEKFLKTIAAELPYAASTGFCFEVITDEPQVRKCADDLLYGLYGEENPRPIEAYETAEPTAPVLEM